MLPKSVLITIALCLLVLSNFFTGLLTYIYVDNSWENEVLENEIEAAANLAKYVEDLRATDLQLITDKEGLINEYRQKLNLQEADNAAANAAAVELQQQIQLIMSEHSTQADNSTTVRSCAAIATDYVVLADVSSRIDKRAGDLGEHAEKIQLKHEQCVKEYNSVQKLIGEQNGQRHSF